VKFGFTGFGVVVNLLPYFSVDSYSLYKLVEYCPFGNYKIKV